MIATFRQQKCEKNTPEQKSLLNFIINNDDYDDGNY